MVPTPEGKEDLLHKQTSQGDSEDLHSLVQNRDSQSVARTTLEVRMLPLGGTRDTKCDGGLEWDFCGNQKVTFSFIINAGHVCVRWSFEHG